VEGKSRVVDMAHESPPLEFKEPGAPVELRLLSELPARLSTELFAGTELVRLHAGRVLFRAGDSGNGCYLVEDGRFQAPVPNAFWRSSAGAPSLVSLRCSMGWRVRRR
jgi:hypothetical protein